MADLNSLRKIILALMQRTAKLSREIIVETNQVERDLKEVDELIAEIEKAKSVPREVVRRLRELDKRKTAEFEKLRGEAPQIELP